MHYQVYEAAVYYEDEILKLNAIGNIALCFQSPYKDCNLNEAVKFVYYNAERQDPGQRAMKLILSLAIIRDINRWLWKELCGDLLFLCNKHESFFFDVYNAQAEKFRRTTTSEGILEDDEENEQDDEGL